MAPHDPSLDELEARIQAAKPAPTPEEAAKIQAEGLSMAMRFGVELLAGLVVGTGLGWLLDRWLGTSPWLLIICFFLGAGAGFLNLKRAADDIPPQ